MAQDKQFQRECQAAFLMVKDDLSEELLSLEELALALQQAGRNPSQKALVKYWTSNTRGISFAQFSEVLKDVRQTSPNQLRHAFRKLDRNRDGYINFEELKVVLLKKDKKFTDAAELRETFSNADINKDGQIDYEEFVKLVCDTAEETKQKALAHLEKRERREARRKKQERREMASNGSAKQEINTTNHHYSDEISVSSDGSGTASTSGIQKDTAHPVPYVSGAPSTVVGENFTHHLKRKGCFLYDNDSHDTGESAEIVSHQYKIILEKACEILVAIRPAGVQEFKDSETTDTLLMIIDHQGRVCDFTKDKVRNKATYTAQLELRPGEYWLVPFTTGCRFRPRPTENMASAKPRADLLAKGKDAQMKLTKEFRVNELRKFTEGTYAEIRRAFDELGTKRNSYDYARDQLRKCPEADIERRGQEALKCQKDFEAQAFLLHGLLQRIPEYQLKVANDVQTFVKAECEYARCCKESLKTAARFDLAGSTSPSPKSPTGSTSPEKSAAPAPRAGPPPNGR